MVTHSPFAGIRPQLGDTQRAPVFLYRRPHELHNCPAVVDHDGRQHGDWSEPHEMHRRLFMGLESSGAVSGGGDGSLGEMVDVVVA